MTDDGGEIVKEIDLTEDRSDERLKADRIAAARSSLQAAYDANPRAIERFASRSANLGVVARRDRRDAIADGRGWCILSTTGNRTLRLARSLEAAGFEVWTPWEIKTWRRPRSRERVERDVAMMPGVVFVRANRLFDLAFLLTLPVSPHPPFQIFHEAGRAGLIGDPELASLRLAHAAAEQAYRREKEAEERRRLKGLRHKFDDGQGVRIKDAAWVGLVGTVSGGSDKEAWVEVAGKRIIIPTWLLLPDGVLDRSSPEDRPA